MNDSITHTKITAKSVANLEPLSSLSEARLEELIGLCTSERLAVGSTLFREGDTDNQTIYLLSGTLTLCNNTGSLESRLSAESEDAKHPVADKQPRQVTAVASTAIDVVRFDNDLLEMMMTWDDLNDLDLEPDANNSGLRASKATSAFQNLPPANLDKIHDRMQSIKYMAGDVVMKEGDIGDYYYLIESGTAKVSRQGAGGQMLLAELGPGDSMGEEALVSNNPRNATITMSSDGSLLRLAKADFDELMREPMLNWIELAAARKLVTSGKAKWLDVRTLSEFRHARVTDAIFCPLRDLRRQVDRLDEKQQYVCYCKTGKRSSAAAYILNERGFKAHALTGGLQALPDQT